MELLAKPDEETVENLVYFHPDELRTREFNHFIDRLLTRGDADEETYGMLTPVQKHVFSVINRAMSRLSRREVIEEITEISYD